MPPTRLRQSPSRPSCRRDHKSRPDSCPPPTGSRRRAAVDAGSR
jgi:hypothetical protein